MAILHRAELTPSKIELVGGWAPTQPWFAGEPGAVAVSVAAYRFDDPDGEVGIETLLVRAGDGPVLQAPVTYRAAPLPGADGWLIGTMQHSVLGERWVYDAVGDPVYLTAVATAALTGGRQADLFVTTADGLVPREPTAAVTGSGADGMTSEVAQSAATCDAVGAVWHEQRVTVVEAGELRIVVVRVLGDGPGPDVAAGAGDPTAVLTGTWTGQPVPQTLATVTVRQP